MKIILPLLLLATVSFASTDLEKRPKPFSYQNSQAVFTDFQKADYLITYDLDKKTASVAADIEFETADSGFPIFDSVQEPTSIFLDGEKITASLTKTPSGETQVRVINKSTRPGVHILKVELPLLASLSFHDDGVKSAFWMGDLDDRTYLENYIPSNFIFDRVPMTVKIKFLGMKGKQRVYANGEVKQISENEYKITYPDNVNMTCPYFHTVPFNSVVEKAFNYKSIDGRDLPGMIYVPNLGDQSEALNRIQTNTVKYMDELEKDYGPFLHSSILVYVNGPSGGMEYSGATVTSEKALGHELFHSYFARGVMPADGNSGWIDEALASWRDKGYSRIASLTGTSKMANHGTYNRATDRQAYTFGERFVSLLDNKFQNKGGMKPFLRELVIKKAFEPITTEDFIQEMNRFFGGDVTQDFQRYVYGKSSETTIMPKKHSEFHHQYTAQELQDLL